MNLRYIDYAPEVKITNLEALPKGTGCNMLLVVESPYPNEYAAKRWLRKLPKSIGRCEWIIRF